MTPADHANAAADAVNALNHATLTPTDAGWEHPADAHDVIGGLDRAASGLPQAIEQTWALLNRAKRDRRLRSTRDADTDLAAAKTALRDAAATAQYLQTALARAHSATSSLYIR